MCGYGIFSSRCILIKPQREEEKDLGMETEKQERDREAVTEKK